MSKDEQTPAAANMYLMGRLYAAIVATHEQEGRTIDLTAIEYELNKTAGCTHAQFVEACAEYTRTGKLLEQPEHAWPGATFREAKIWHIERNPGSSVTSYYLVLVDSVQAKPIRFELEYDSACNGFGANAYLPGDYDYTIHDGCDHENGECVCDTPEFETQAYRDNLLARAQEQLLALARQFQQQQIAERLRSKGNAHG